MFYSIYSITLLYIMSLCCILHSVIPLLYILENCAKVHAMQCKWGWWGARFVSLVDKLKLTPVLPVVMHHNTPNISPTPCRGKKEDECANIFLQRAVPILVNYFLNTI